MAYITKKELLAEIHNCKMSYSSFLEPEFRDYDVILQSMDQLTPAVIAETVSKKGGDHPPVFRIMTYSHIPKELDKKKRSRVGNTDHAVTNFSPFKHFIIENGSPKEVLRSHWVGGFENGHFSTNHGRITNKLGAMFLKLVENYARIGKFRSYTYLEEMKGNALQHLVAIALKFDEAKSDNPFGFYSISIKHCFVRVLNIEKRAQEIRDDLLIASGAAPSMTRQIDHELSMRPEYKKPDDSLLIAKRGRKTAAARAAIEETIKKEHELTKE
jgi:hypothetical protein